VRRRKIVKSEAYLAAIYSVAMSSVQKRDGPTERVKLSHSKTVLKISISLPLAIQNVPEKVSTFL